jgi:hypothetical protein
MTFTGITQARRRLGRLADGLRDVASGAALDRAAAFIRAQVEAVARDKAGRHEETGAALGSIVATSAGGLVQLSNVGYLRFHSWWPFRRGSMPPFVVKRASLILAREIRASLGIAGSAVAAEASAVIDEAAGAERTQADRRQRKAARRA